ncbi:MULTISPECIES: molybdate ABC transporter permease subunit [unclassified Prosthecochloris]|uniref:molybdate ABC transporter permease subunit n=1 Tax=unclassified Prosthecochloris TaxID=2632826 RepID=UPI00223DA510|nr:MULTISPECIES: ABC transporter permease subunit [unclassified Prosthecochloris]UZJ38304.1 ABC transporter permease subunit [Prosthecochloris sp. SCSIO W1103]
MMMHSTVFPSYRDIGPIVLSLQTAAIVLVSHIVFSISLGYLLSRKKMPFRSLLDGLVTLPLVFPPIATGFLLLLILGRHGVIGPFLSAKGIEIIFSPMGVYLAAFLSGLPLVVKPVQSAIENTETSFAEASYVLGKSEIVTFLQVTLPNIKQVVLAGLMLSVGRSFGEVGITLMLGGNISGRTETMSLAIYNAVFEGNFEKALVFSGLLALISILAFYGMNRLKG